MSIFEVLAHEGEEAIEAAQPALDEIIRANSIKFSLIASGVILLLTVVSLIIRQKNEALKYILFIGFILVILANSIYLVGSTLYLNRVSETGGPIHWHADFEIWRCNEKISLKDPEGFSNKIGEAVVHEHNDDRMHFEGVILDKHNASVGHFFESLGGSMNEDHLTIPTNSGDVTLQTGHSCNGKTAMLQVFLYKAKDKVFTQRKLENPLNYVISPHSSVPPGDCIIIELDVPKDKTDKLCQQYQLKQQLGEIKYGN